MRFLVDAQLPPGLARWLASQGYPSDHVYDLGLGAPSDDKVEAKARELGAVIWSKDSDFADHSQQGQGLQVVWFGWATPATPRFRQELRSICRPSLQIWRQGKL